MAMKSPIIEMSLISYLFLTLMYECENDVSSGHYANY